MPVLQDLIHKVEVGGGMRSLRLGIPILAVLGVIVLYNVRCFKNMSTQEAMDSAQLARNIAQGKGYTTSFVRPFSMYLLRQHNQQKPDALNPDKLRNLSEIQDRHPDLANPPVYPAVLAGLMKVLPFRYAVDNTHPFWSELKPPPQVGRLFSRYEPDFLISLFNQALFFGVIVLFFFLARRLFEPRVAWLSAALLFCTEVFWRFSVSGLSTMLLLLIFMGLIWCLVLVEHAGRELPEGRGRLIALAVLAGVLAGMGSLTRYSFGWLILPVLLFLILFSGPQRLLVAAMALITFAVVLSPWIIRNFQVSGTPFGTAGYALIESTFYSEHRLQRSLDPDLSGLVLKLGIFKLFAQTLLINVRQIFQVDFPRLGGGWISAFFFVGLLVGFQSPALKRLRYFLMASLVVLTVAQALGRTQLSEDSPEINSENLLVLLAPLVLVYGVSLFFLFLDQFNLHIRELRYAAVGAFGALICLPMIFAFLPPKSKPISYPPYYPPSIQVATDWLKENELMMSDMPWAVAWYGQRQCLWLTQTPQEFLAINDYQKPIQTLFLTRLTIGTRLWTLLLLGAHEGWGNLLFQAQGAWDPDPLRWPRNIKLMVRTEGGTMTGFPLHYWQLGEGDRLLEQFILTDRERPVKTP